MTEKEMLAFLQYVWDNMTSDKDRQAYGEMLVLLDNMVYYLRHDLQCEYPPSEFEVPKGDFDF